MISGKIIDAEQLPIDGATIILQAMDSTYIAASISNTDGIFVFNSQQEEYRLIIQHILYETKQMAGKGNTNSVDYKKSINPICISEWIQSLLFLLFDSLYQERSIS